MIGGLGFVCLAYAVNAWIFVLGIAVFSIGEMTAHPKYYSYVGLVAPADRKAVYMGYAFLYGVIGSLVGSNLGGDAVRDDAQAARRPGGNPRRRSGTSGSIFAALDVVAIVGLLLYNRFFSADTPATNRMARRIMIGVYLLLASSGCGSCTCRASARPRSTTARWCRR